MSRCLLLACAMLLVNGCVSAADRCPENGEWAAACFETSGGVRQLKSQYREKLAVRKKAVKVITISDPHEVVAVDARGVIVVPGIYHAGDFDYPTAVQNVGRFASAGKCGFFDVASFAILVPAEYDQCSAFHDGEAIACKDCQRYCTDEECHDYKLIGGQGIAFDAKGKALRQFRLPALKDACGKPGVARVGKVNDAIPLLECKNAPHSPFQM